MNFTSPNEIRARFAEIQEQTSEIISFVAEQIKNEAHPDGNMDWLQHCAKTMEALKRDQRSLQDVETHLIDVLENTLGFETDKYGVSTSGLRILTIEVSQGMLNQHLLTLTHAKSLGKVYLGEKFEITLPDGTSFNTELCDPGNKLRERGLIRQFYEESKVKEGDDVVLEEAAPGKWHLRRRYEPGERERMMEELEKALSTTALGSKPDKPAVSKAEAPPTRPAAPAASGTGPVEIEATIDWGTSDPKVPGTT